MTTTEVPNLACKTYTNQSVGFATFYFSIDVSDVRATNLCLLALRVFFDDVQVLACEPALPRMAALVEVGG
jgi:hypothetical protein